MTKAPHGLCDPQHRQRGWLEWEGDNLFYFREFSEKTAYPLAVNVVFYVMTH